MDGQRLKDGATAEGRPALFVYYRVPAAHQQAWLEAVQAMQHGMRARWPGLVARLMRRSDDVKADAPATWMEVYEHPEGIGGAFEADLLAEVDRLPLQWIGERHIERFTDCSTASTASFEA
ncbi:DUF4936 family protein [Aquabacterium fontiphilum]|uniref:DUF4936 family protein n=1 Tax=Aquabacterium fontiphilum TaxID=450365 RepID=UPI001378878D|nr:DUF4936 family protein [Aquabacterium fontiphilum]NBD20063.1 DUF4936 family protein [Aquabacterium fontiphilum]